MIIKFTKKRFNLIKICAVFTTVCFVVSTLGANLYAIPLAENANQKYEDVFNKVSSISAEYGKITSSKDANSDITIINIQDLHCHPQTQRNISKIITQIADKYNLKRIYVEGGYGDINTSWLNTIKDEKIKKQIIEGLLEEGILTGSEYYKLTNNNEVELKGIDEEQIHKDNVRRLSWIISNQDKYRDVITKVENEINTLEKMYVNSRNERFNRDVEKYLTNEIDSRRFYRQLAKYVKDINEHPDKYNNITAIRLEDYPNITKFIALRKTSKDIDVREVTQQLQMVINELKNKLPYNVYTRLLSETENLSDSQKVVELITMLCKKEGINLESRYKALNTFLESNGINRELNTVELVQEERQLLSEIRKALSYNNEEYEITFISDFSKYFKDYLEYKLTDADWKYFEKEYEQFRTLYAKYAVVDRIQEIDGDFEEINKYYKINDQRNNIFVANLLKGEEISVSETDRVRQEEEILKNSKEVIIAVTGGFHSTELEEILAKKEVNTIVITPSIFEGIEKATKQYKGIIKEQSKFFQHQALAYTLASCTTDAYKKNLLYSMAKEFLGGDVERLREVLGQDVDLTVFDNLQPLTEQEQEQLSNQKNIFVSAASDMIDLVVRKGAVALIRPNIDAIILDIFGKLVAEGVFLSKGAVFKAEELGMPNLDGISPEIYSRMPAFIQEALVAQEYGIYEIIAEESARKDTSEEDFADEIVDETAESEAAVEDEIVDSSYFSEEEKAELLEKVRDEEKPFSVDQDLVFSVFEKMIVPFMEDNKVDNIDEYYELFLRKLFSLQPEILQFLNDKMDGQSVKDLLYDYEAEVINKNLTYLLARYNKKLSSLTDFSRIVLLFENIEKLNSLSERDFDYFMNLPNQFFIYVWEKSENASQLEAKIAAGKKFYDKNIDTDLAKAYFANAEKLKDLGVLYHQKFTALNKEAQLFILENAKNTSNIEKILTFYEGMRLSSDFDSKRNEDFKDPKFKALVKYISSTEDRDFYNKLFFGNYNEDELRIIVDSIDDIDFIKNYIWKYEDVYKKLFENLVESHIKKVASENNHLALKLILNKEFNQILTESGIDNISDEDNIVARYYSAIAVSRLMYDGAEKEVVDYDFTDENFIELIKEVTDLYTEIMKEMSNIVLLDRDTQIYALCNSERIITKSIFVDGSKEFNRFNTDTLKEIMSYLNIPEDHLVEYRRVKDIEGSEDNVEKKKASERWLDSIKFFKMAYDKAKGYFVFMGHGEINRDGNLVVYSPKAKREDKGTYYIDNGEATGEDIEVITPEDMANALFELATRSDDPVDLKNITIDLSCCYSYLFARNVYDKLKQKFESENQKESYPTIITAGGLETELGYTIFTGDYVSLKSGEGNLHQGIDKVLSPFQDGSVHALTLGMVGVSEYLFKYSNITMFTSFSDETLLKRIEETKKHISEFFKDSKEKSIEIESTTSNSRVKQKTKVPNLPIFGFEASIFKEDNYAPIWEEVVYRFAPALIFTILISVTMMFAPAGFVLFTKMGFAVILTLFQTIFVKAHIVTDWLRAKDSGGEKSSEEVPETSISDKQSKTVDLGKVFEKDLTFEDKINKIFKTVKERLFAVFSDSKDAESFKIFYKTNKIAAEHKDGLIIPTIAFTIPYVVVMCFFPSIQAVMIATIVSMALHAINNIVAKIIKEKGLLQKKQKDIDFQDIKRRIKHVKLLLENPQVKRDLSELKEGYFALKFALENKDSRRAEYLLDFEKIRIHFIDTLDKEKENTIAEIERIEKKKRITRKDREKIQALREKSSEYTRIRSELLNDTSKVEETIKKIDNLLSVFEEVDIILDMIENFKAENGNIRETRILERDFLDFAENTFMKELMSLYDGKVSGIHVNRIVSSSRIFGTKMHFGNNVRMMYKLMLSSILHDIGKNIIPKTILNKQGSFDDLERNIMEMHVVFGGLILRSSILKSLSYTAENHHFTKEGLPRSYSFKTKIDELLNSKDGKTKNLYSAIAYSLDGEYENIIAQIVAFLKELNPQLSFDSESQYPRNLDDIKNILKDMNIDLTESQQEKLDPLLQEIKRMEDERFIAKIVTLLDVYEAVSPKLSFDTERTYQFPRQIRDISNMLENIDMYIELTDSQKREVIILLTEIAQIDSEEDESKKQDLERNFIKKVLYDRSKSVVIKYIREQNYKNVRENAFKVIFTKSPKDIFKELGKTEEEFMKDFEKNPKEIIDKCMSLVDTSALEFDPEVVRVFLDFYFNFDDVKVNNTIIDNLNKKKENRFIVHIKDVLYSLYKLQRSVNRMLVRFTPVIASVFHGLGEQEKDISVKDLFDIDTEIINHDVLIRKSDGEIYILHFDEKSFEQKGRRFAGVTMLPKNYGIKEIEYDENGRISNVILEGGTRIEPLFTEEEKEKIEREQGKLVGNKENNLPFEDFILDSIKENIREITGNNVAETVDIYLDSETVISDMETAIKENKLMIIHVFEEGFKTEDLSLRQLYEKYNQILSLINGGFAQIFSGNTEAEEQILKQIEEDLTAEEKEDSEWTKRETAKALFSLREILKNDFDHGNNGLIEYPIALYISKNEEGKVSDIITYNAGAKSTDIDSIDKKTLSNLIYESYISGSKKGAKYMESSLFINFEDGFISTDGAEGKYKIHRTRVTLKSKQEQEDALAKYNQYIQENRQKELEKQQRLAKMSEEEKEAALRRDAESTHAAKMAEFWEDFFSILKPFGVKLGNYAHVWEEALFRYLPTVFILLGYMNPLVGLGIQVVFILAHPLGKWMAARMNWEKAKKEGKQVGEKAGVGDLFKQIGKDFSLLTPTLVLMLPYVGALLSLAINPALSLIITPAIFTFTDVIVKWLTKKDSGGEVISIDKNLVIFITIVSLGSYIFLPLIPVIHPIVNALINPIVITNAINAGYLHYEYNKRQQNRGKSLSIFSSSLSEARKAELLAKLDNNEEALNSLIKICREESINFDLSKDTPLTDLKIACFKKYSGFLTDDFGVENPELKRINFFRRLFSLSEDNLEFLYNEIDNFGVELLLLDTDDADYEADDIDANLTTLLSVHKEELLKLAKTDYETFTDTLYNFLRPSNIKKVTSLSKEDFAYLISPSMVKHYNTILLLSKDSSQLKIKLAANKAFGFTMRDIKQEILRKILTIFDNVKDLSDIEKILQLCEENKISSDFDSSKGVEDFKDMRFKAFVRYVSSTDDKSFYNDLFKFYGKKTVFNWKGEDSYDKKDQRILKIIVDSIDDISFIKEYLLNSDRNKIYKTLFAGLADLDIKKVAVENDHLALKLLIDENFNKILNDSRIHDNVPQEKILVARYHAAIAVSRFIYDSVGNEISGYDLSNDEIKEQIGKITELYIEAVRQAGKIVIMDSQTKIYGLFNDEIMEGTERFNEEAILKMLGIIREANPNQKLPAPTFYKRNDRDHGPEAAKSWLDAMEDLILESTQKKQEKAYFVFRGHGEHKDNEDPDKSDYLKVNGSEKIYAKELAERLFNLAKRTENPVDLRRVTIDLSCCDSYFFARSVHKYLEQMYEEYAKTNKGFKETFPIIISAGGLEERSGITIDIRKISDSRKKLGNTKWIGNLHEGILQILDGKSELTLGMLALSEYKFLFSNITIFASFDDEMTKEIEKVRKNTLDVFGKYSIGTQTDKTESQLTQEGEKEETAETKRNVGGEMTVPALHAGRMEMSILKPLNLKIDDRPYIWEEGLFRYLPTAIIVSKFLISLTTPFTGIYVAAVFIAIQLLFISAHSVVKWKVEKSTNENLGVGGLFKQIGHDIKNLIIPTLTLMLPYAGSLITLAINPALSILLTPALLTFADVIVKWLTRKDSGGEVSINKNLIIVSLIASLVSYTLLPAIPVINPLVNALINPVLAVNTAGAGYLHYEYNKRQENRDEHIKIIADSISLDGNYEVSKHFFRFRPGDLIKFKDSSSIMKEEGNSITISLPNNWNFSKHAANNGLNIQDGKVSIKKEEQLQRFVVIIDENNKEHIFVINQSGYKEVTISLDKDNGVPLEKLKKTTGVDIDEKGGVLPEDKDKIVLKIHDLKFESCFEPFTIEFNGKKNNFIFRNKKLYKISEYGRLEEVNLDESTLLSYGIESFKSDGNKITSFIISKERQFGAAVRQAVGIDEEEMEYRMEQILASGETGVELFLLDDFKEIPSAFVTYFFQVQGLENSLIEKILETHGNTISPENLEKSLTNNGFLEEDAKMWVERIFAEYISNFSNIDISEEIPLDFLRYFLEQEESKDILKRQDIIELLSRRGKTISKEDLKNELKKLGFSEEDAQNMADEVELDVYGEKIPTRFLDFYFKDYPLEGVKDIGRTLVLRNPDLTSIAFLRRFLKKKGFSEEDIKNLIEEIKKAFKGEKEGEKGKLATAIVQSLLLKDDLIEKLGYKFTKKQAQQIANKCRKKDGNLVSFETLQEVFNEFFGEKATENLPKIMEYLYSKDEELNSKLYDSDKADNAEGIRISFLRTFFEEEGLSEKDVIVFFFERAKSISIENLERELLGLGYSEQKAKNLIERIRSKYPQKIDKFKFEKIPTDYITSLFNKGFVDRKIILLLESGKAMSKEDLEEEFGKYWSKDRAKDLVEKIFAEYIKDIRRENIHVLSRYQTERILLRAGVKSENIQINEDGTFPDTIKKDLEEANLQDKELEIDDTVTREKLISLLNYTPVLVSMSIQALSRAFALDKQSTEKRDDSITTLGGLIGYLKKKKKDKNDTYLRGYFAEIYLSNKTVAGTINGLKIRLQLPDNTSEPGIDLVDPIKGMKVQVKIDIGRSTQKASSKNPDIPIACTMEVAGNKDKSLIKGFVEMKTIDAFAEEFLSLITDEKLSLTGEESDIKLSDITGHEIFAIDELLGIFNRAAILPENMGLVNRIMQSKFGNAFIAATVIAFKEFRASLEPNFVDLHQTAAGKRGAQEVASLANRYNIKENDTLVTKIVKSVLGIIFKGASIVKHIAIDYRYIKASGIQEAINMFGKDARLTEDGQIEVAIVEDIEQLQNSFTLVNTGLKVDGASIYRIKNTDLLMFGAKGQQSIKIVQTINGTEQLKKSVMEILKSSGQQIDDIETQGIVTKQGEGIEVKEGIIEIGEMELKGKTSQQIKEFITSSLEINRATGIMYGQKTIIGLEYIGASDINKLKSAIENGRARKVITKEQYVALRADMNENKENGFNEYLLELRKNGIEIYIDAREQVIEQKEIEDGIAGQIVTENGELYIQDYYSLEQTKLLKVDSEMLKERSLEQIILSESETIFVGIEILLEQFRQSNINVVQREFGALLGKIKLSLNIGELNFKDIENILYNIDYNKIPKLELAPSKNLQEYTKEDINAMIDSLILNMEETSEISIILKAIRKNKNFNEQDYDAFVQVIKERILAKTALIKGYKEYGLKDKRLEKLLGQLLFKQLDFNLEDKDPKEEKNFDFTYIDKDEQIRVVNGDKEKSEDNKEAEYVFMRKIVQDTEKARRGDKVAINSIIDIILTYGDEYKEKQIARDMDKNDIRNYRAMMSAA